LSKTEAGNFANAKICSFLLNFRFSRKWKKTFFFQPYSPTSHSTQ
jgi:hypothetical protein